MATQIAIETMESIVRNFGNEEFTTENVKAAMVTFHPRRRLSINEASRILSRYGMAKAIGRISIQTKKGSQITTVWRSLK